MVSVGVRTSHVVIAITTLVAACTMLPTAVLLEEIWLAAILLPILVLAARYPLHVAPEYRQQLSAAPGVAAAMLLHPPFAIGICALGHLSAEAQQTQGSQVRPVFSTSLVALQAATASFAASSVRGQLPSDSIEGGMGVLAAAVLSWLAVGSVLREAIFSLRAGHLPGRRWLERCGQTATTEFALLLVGGLAALSADGRPWLLPLMAMAGATVYRAFANQQQSLIRAQQEREVAKRGQTSAEQEREELAEILDASRDIVITLDANSRIRYANPAARALLRLSDKQSLAEFSVERVFKNWRRSTIAASAAGLWSGETEMLTPGGPIPVAQVVSVHRTPAGGVSFISTVARDIRDRKSFEQKLQYLAGRDPLTGVLNRRRFEYELEKALAAARHAGALNAILYVDLDGFKNVNDRLGHQTGDRLLQGVVSTLQAHPTVKSSGVLGRLGGDEFAILIKERTPGDLSSLAEDVLRLIGTYRVPVGSQYASVTASIGIEMIDETAGSPNEILARADAAMYEAKQLGNCVAFAAPRRRRSSA